MVAFLAFNNVLAVVNILVCFHRDSFAIFSVFIGAGLDDYVLWVHFYSKFRLAVCYGVQHTFVVDVSLDTMLASTQNEHRQTGDSDEITYDFCFFTHELIPFC